MLRSSASTRQQRLGQSFIVVWSDKLWRQGDQHVAKALVILTILGWFYTINVGDLVLSSSSQCLSHVGHIVDEASAGSSKSNFFFPVTKYSNEAAQSYLVFFFLLLNIVIKLLMSLCKRHTWLCHLDWGYSCVDCRKSHWWITP